MLTREREPETQTPPLDRPAADDVRHLRHWYGTRHAAGGAVVGVVLILIGMLSLLATITQSAVVGELLVLSIGVIFLTWGIAGRLAGPMIPGCILTGLGMSIVLTQQVFTGLSGDAQGGLIVLGLALGFLAILPVTYAVKGGAHWWPLIPGGVLLFVAVALLIGGAWLNALNVFDVFWPVILIATGAALLLHRAQSSRGRHYGNQDLPQ